MAETLQIASGGTKLHALQWRAAQGESRDAFLCVHGVESHAGWFTKLAECLVRNGHSVVAYDRLGFGKSTGPRGDLSSRAAGLEELLAARAQLLAEHDQIHVIGLSWGAILCAYAATVDPSAFHSWNFIVPGWFPRRATYAGKTRVWLKELKKGSHARFPLALNPADFTSQPDQQALIAADPWRNQSITGRFLWHSARMIVSVRSQLKKQQLARANLFLAQRDNIIDNQATRRLFADMQTEHVFCREYPDTRHSLILEVPGELAQDLCTHTGAKARTDARVAP